MLAAEVLLTQKDPHQLVTEQPEVFVRKDQRQELPITVVVIQTDHRLVLQIDFQIVQLLLHQRLLEFLERLEGYFTLDRPGKDRLELVIVGQFDQTILQLELIASQAVIQTIPYLLRASLRLEMNRKVTEPSVILVLRQKVLWIVVHLTSCRRGPVINQRVLHPCQERMLAGAN